MSPIVVEKCAEYWGIDCTCKVCVIRHLYSVGSIFARGFQDATVWGNGLLNGNAKKAKLCLCLQKLDVRAVRGSLTREVLIKNGQKCPEIYGDPAILMLMFYRPASNKKYNVSVIIHHTHNLDRNTIPADMNIIDILTTGYMHFIDEVCSTELVISSSLHGIILAEAYGVPAVFLAEVTLCMPGPSRKR